MAKQKKVLTPAQLTAKRAKDALRQRNSRMARKKSAGKDTKVKGKFKAPTPFNPVGGQNQANYNNEMVTVEHYIKTSDTHFFLTKDKNEDIWHIYCRQKGVGKARHEAYKTEQEAKDALGYIERGQTSAAVWYGYAQHLDSAKQIKTAKTKPSTAQPLYSPTYSLLIALEELKGRNCGPERMGKLKSWRHNIYQIVKETPLPHPNEPNAVGMYRGAWVNIMNTYLEKLCSKVAVSSDSVWTIFNLCRAIATTVDELPQYRFLANEIGPYLLKQSKDEILPLFEKEGKINKPGHHKYMPMRSIKAFLDVAWEKGPKTIYPLIVLNLSTGSRPEELIRLMEHRTKYLDKSSKSLLYKWSEKLPKGVPILVTKTPPKTNPGTSVVTRVILQEEKLFSPSQVPFGFFKKNGECRAIKNADYHRRNIRTTCATMLAYCDGAKTYRSTMRMVQDRLAHVDLSMAIKIYAKDGPDSSLDPEVYMNFSKLKMKHKGKIVDISEGSNLWDLFLLSDVLQRFALQGSNRKSGLNELKDAVMREVKFQQTMRTTDEIVKKLEVVV